MEKCAGSCGYVVEDFFVQSVNKLFCRLLLPDGEGLPLVVFAHGFDSSYKNMLPYAEFFSSYGYAACVFDFSGGSLKSESEGSNLEMSIFTEENDLLSVIKNLSGHPKIDSSKIFVCGESQGGLVSAITVSHNPSLARGLILLYPAFCIPEHARKRFSSKSEIKDVNRELWMPLGKIYYENLLDYDVYDEIKSYPGPVTVIHGDMDKVVDISYSVRACDVYKNVEMHTIKNAEHGFSGPDQVECKNLVLDFLNKHA